MAYQIVRRRPCIRTFALVEARSATVNSGGAWRTSLALEPWLLLLVSAWRALTTNISVYVVVRPSSARYYAPFASNVLTPIAASNWQSPTVPFLALWEREPPSNTAFPWSHSLHSKLDLDLFSRFAQNMRAVDWPTDQHTTLLEHRSQ